MLETFDQVFDSTISSHAVIGLRASLINGIGRNAKTLSTQIVKEKAAGSADTKGGVAALTAASDEAVAELKGWVETQTCDK